MSHRSTVAAQTPPQTSRDHIPDEPGGTDAFYLACGAGSLATGNVPLSRVCAAAPPLLTRLLARLGVSSFSPWQLRVAALAHAGTGTNIGASTMPAPGAVVCAPTGGGKTLAAEFALSSLLLLPPTPAAASLSSQAQQLPPWLAPLCNQRAARCSRALLRQQLQQHSPPCRAMTRAAARGYSAVASSLYASTAADTAVSAPLHSPAAAATGGKGQIALLVLPLRALVRERTLTLAAAATAAAAAVSAREDNTTGLSGGDDDDDDDSSSSDDGNSTATRASAAEEDRAELSASAAAVHALFAPRTQRAQRPSRALSAAERATLSRALGTVSGLLGPPALAAQAVATSGHATISSATANAVAAVAAAGECESESASSAQSGVGPVGVDSLAGARARPAPLPLHSAPVSAAVSAKQRADAAAERARARAQLLRRRLRQRLRRQFRAAALTVTALHGGPDGSGDAGGSGGSGSSASAVAASRARALLVVATPELALVLLSALAQTAAAAAPVVVASAAAVALKLATGPSRGRDDASRGAASGAQSDSGLAETGCARCLEQTAAALLRGRLAGVAIDEAHLAVPATVANTLPTASPSVIPTSTASSRAMSSSS